MQEGSPPTEEAPSATGEATPEPTEESAEEVAAPERTADEVEAIWKNRVAGKDRAHAEAERVLRSQIDDLNRQMQSRQSTDTANMSEVEREKARADAAEARAEQAERQRVLDLRQVKYAAAAEAIDDPSVLAVMDEAKLAAMNARLSSDDAPAPTVIDPNAARRTSSTQSAAPRERSIEELEADLKKNEPAFKESLGT